MRRSSAKGTHGRRATGREDQRTSAALCPAPFTLTNITAKWAHWPMRIYLAMVAHADDDGYVLGADGMGITRKKIARELTTSEHTVRLSIIALVASGAVEIAKRTLSGTIFSVATFGKEEANEKRAPGRASPLFQGAHETALCNSHCRQTCDGGSLGAQSRRVNR